MTCPIIDGAVRGMAAFVSDTDGSFTSSVQPEPIRKHKSNTLKKWARIFDIYVTGSDSLMLISTQFFQQVARIDKLLNSTVGNRPYCFTHTSPESGKHSFIVRNGAEYIAYPGTAELN